MSSDPKASPTTPNAPRQDIDDAFDFDPRDPLFGLSTEQLRGPVLERRSVLRLLAAAGSLSFAHLIPEVGIPSAKAASGGTLTAGWAGVGEIRTLDPAQINQVLQFQIASNVLSGLTHIDPALIAQGDLATDWKISSDGTEYSFNLREGVTFHNGDKFTADDVLFTFNRSSDKDLSIHSRVLENVAELIKVNDYAVRFKLKSPQASFLVKTLERSSGRAMTIVSRGALEKMGTTEYGLTPVGTGPFRCTFHQLGQGVVLERFADYYDPERPKLDKVVIKPIPDPEPIAAAIEAGDIQLIGGNPVAPELVDRFESNPELSVDIVPGPGFQSIWMNPWVDPFKVSDFNKPLSELMTENGFKVRLAIAKALDRERYIKQAEFGRSVPAYGTINPAMDFFFDKELGSTSNQRFDLAEAKRLLAEAGFPDGKGFPQLTIKTTASTRRGVQVIRSILKRNLNIDLKIEVKDSPVLLDEFLSMRWDIIRIGSGGDFDPDDGLVDWMQTESKFNGTRRDKEKLGFGYFSEREVDKLIDEQRLQTDLEQRKAMVKEANRLTSDKVACAFLYHPVDILVRRKNVNFPKQSRIPGLVDLDRTSLS